MVAPETENARLPTVERRTGGTSRRCEVEDRRRVDVMSETRVNTTVGRTERLPLMDRYVIRLIFFVFSYKTLLIDILHILSPSVFFILAM